MQNRHVARARRHRRVRKKIRGTEQRPRLSVFRSNKHVYAQVIDDVNGRTVASASTVEKDFAGATATVDAAKKIGKLVGERAKGAGVGQRPGGGGRRKGREPGDGGESEEEGEKEGGGGLDGDPAT